VAPPFVPLKRDQEKRVVPETELFLKTEQLLRFRLAFAAVCLILTVALGIWARSEFDLRLVVYLIGIVLIYSSVGMSLVKLKLIRSDTTVKIFNAVLLTLDILALTAAVHLTLGIDSDLYVLYLLPILFSSYTFSRRGIYATCLFVSLSYVSLLLSENANSITMMTDAAREGGLAGAYLHRLVGRLVARSFILVSVTFIWGAFCGYVSRLAQQVADRLREQLKDNERLVQEVKGQAAREHLINSINKALRDTLDLDRILEIASRELNAAIRASACVIVCPSVEPGKPPKISQYAKDIHHDDSASGNGKPHLPEHHQTLSVQVCSFLLERKSRYEKDENGQVKKKTFLISDPHHADELNEVKDELDSLELSWLIVQPMIYGDTSEGIIIIAETGARVWTSSDLELVKAVAGQVAVAIENAKLLQQLSSTNEDLVQKNLNLDAKNLELGAMQTQLVHQEKMASLGRLVAGIAHELNNPINFVHGNLPYLQSYFEDLKKLIGSVENLSEEQGAVFKKLKEDVKYDFVVADLENILADLNEGTERIRHIIRNLKSFSRLDEAELKEASINEGLESTLKILSQYYGRDKIYADVKLGQLPPVLCYPGQLNQVWMNLLSNAAEAVNSLEEPKVSVSTTLTAGEVLIKIEDNGSGIKKDVQNKIFEPFFTTKPVGQGTGLGLSICHSIIERHGGKIWFESAPQRGTIFNVLIPVQAKPVPDSAAPNAQVQDASKVGASS
jgi:signal transduction histidine kinase